MSQRDFCRTDFGCHAINHPAPEARTQRAHGFPLGDHALHGRIGILLDDAEGNTKTLQIPGKNMRRIARVFLIEIERDQLERHGGFFAQPHQHIEHRVTIFAAGQAHHHLVARFDHVEIGNGLPGQAAQALGEFVGLELLLVADGGGDGVHGKRFYRFQPLHSEGCCGIASSTAADDRQAPALAGTVARNAMERRASAGSTYSHSQADRSAAAGNYKTHSCRHKHYRAARPVASTSPAPDS